MWHNTSMRRDGAGLEGIVNAHFWFKAIEAVVLRDALCLFGEVLCIKWARGILQNHPINWAYSKIIQHKSGSLAGLELSQRQELDKYPDETAASFLVLMCKETLKQRHGQ